MEEALEELRLRRSRVQGEIIRYLATPADERTDFLLEIADLKREIIDLKIAFLKATNEEERKSKEEKIKSKEEDIKRKELLLLRLLPPQTQEIQPDNCIFSSFSCILVFSTRPTTTS